MKKLIRDYLTFNRKERNGILFLLGLLALLLMAQPIVRLLPKPPPPDLSAFEAEIAAYYAAVAAYDSTQQAERKAKWDKPKKVPASKPVERFAFDPNTLTEDQSERLGLKPWQTRIIQNYLNKGGQFRVKADFLKSYAIDSILYADLKSYLLLPDTLPKRTWASKDTTFFAKRAPTLAPFDLNSADTNQLRKLRGIGKVLSRRIVTYRDKLGGFHSIDQLAEVYGLRAETLESIRPFLTLDTVDLRLVDVNAAPVETLQQHPYIRWNLAKVIVAYRDKHGPFLSKGGYSKY